MLVVIFENVPAVRKVHRNHNMFLHLHTPIFCQLNWIKMSRQTSWTFKQRRDWKLHVYDHGSRGKIGVERKLIFSVWTVEKEKRKWFFLIKDRSKYAKQKKKLLENEFFAIYDGWRCQNQAFEHGRDSARERFIFQYFRKPSLFQILLD